MEYPYTPIESIVYPGFYEIPGYSRYVISEDGVVLNKQTATYLKGSRNPAGYFNYRLTGDDNNVRTWGRHRLMCFIFKYPGIIFTKLTVNHKNGIKGDDRPDNLEWLTYQENQEHAGMLGLTSKCCPISVRDVDTGEVTEYPSIIECARKMNVSKDTINYRVKIGDVRIFPERKQYRIADSDKPWIIHNHIDNDLQINGTSKAVLMRNVVTNEIIKFDQMRQLADYLKISPSTITTWINKPDQPVLPGFVQLKKLSDPTPWRHVENPYIELNNSRQKRIIKVFDTATEKEHIYFSIMECARDRKILDTTLNWRLKSGEDTIYSDGCKYNYY